MNTFESYLVKASLLKSGTIFTLPIEVSEGDNITFRCQFNELFIEESAETFFEAFQKIRDSLLSVSVGLLCNGSSINAHASQMMSNSSKIYLLHPFHSARLEDVVEVLDFCELSTFPNTEEQKRFFEEWSTMPTMKDYLFFYETQSPLSQWYKCNFTENGIIFQSAEQYMMYHKALLFDDNEIATKILATTNQRKQKELGRLVQNFKENVWIKHRAEIVYNGNLLKFQQNPELKEYLISTSGKILVEASPTDCIWGIGLDSNQPESANVRHWKGLNLLGYALTQVRETIIQSSL